MHFRPLWTEFLRLETADDCAVVVKHFLNSRKATLRDFQEHTGIDLMEYMGTFVEVGGTKAPTGPVVPGPVFPILAFKKSEENGAFIPQRLSLDGLFYHTKKYAWVQTDLWEEVTGDTDFFEKHILLKKTKKKSKRKQV